MQLLCQTIKSTRSLPAGLPSKRLPNNALTLQISDKYEKGIELKPTDIHTNLTYPKTMMIGTVKIQFVKF